MGSDFVSSAPHTMCICSGEGRHVAYFKNEKKKLLSMFEDYCPMCHPNLAQPILPRAEEVEIDRDGFLELSECEGWTVVQSAP